jgi:PAS domain S-box-containing protein
MLAGVALLIILGGMAVLAIWRTSNDRNEHAELERKFHAVAALQEARAQLYLSGTLLASAALSEDPLPFVDSYGKAVSEGEASLHQAEAALVAENDRQALSALQGLDAQLGELRPTIDNLATVALNSDTETARSLAFQYLPQIWPPASLVLTDLGELARVEQAKLTDATAEANNQASTSLWMIVTFGVAGFVVALAVLANLIRSVVRPLASLQRSVRAVTSGDMESRAEVSGPQEVALLAADFNEMIGQLNGTAAQMGHRLEVESAVARVSALLGAAEDTDSGLNSALQILAEAVDAEHAYIFMFKEDNTKMDNTHEWNAAGKFAPKERFANLDCATFGWWVGKLARNEEVVVHDVSQLPTEAAAENALLTRMRTKSALAVPFGPSGKPDGFVGFGGTRVSHVWQEDDVQLLRLGSESISSFINRRRTEQALRESEGRFRSLSASAPIGIFLTDTSGGCVYVNEQLLSISKLSLEQALGLGWAKIIHPDDRAAVIAEKERATRDNDQFSCDFRIISSEDDTRWVSVRSKPMGSLGARVGTLEDITERKQAENALRQSEERFRTLGASAPIGIFHADAVGKVVFVNERFVDIAGVSFPDNEDHNWYDIVHPSDRDFVISEVIGTIKSRAEFARDFRLLTPQGITRWVSARAKDMRDKDGRFLGLMGTIEDITERREREEALAQSEERFRSLSASAPVGILLTSADDTVTYTNESLRAIVGMDSDERLEDLSRDSVLTAFVHPEDRQGIIEAHFEASNREAYEFLREFRILTRQGETRWVRVHVIPIMSGEGAQTGRVGTVEDITEHKMLEKERQGAYERTTLLLAMAAEARDPYTEHHLFRIRGYSEAIALQMGLSPRLSKEIGLASLLHDIGKTRVPDAILTKPGPLTEEEWQVMRRHTIWGEELLPDSPWFTTARQIARSHHENWDGSGYPDGVKEDEIPLSARIVAVADGFDAMTSKRPYKGAWPPARAMRELRDDKGHRYCPQVVEAFERAVAEGTIARIATVRRSNLSDLMKAA